LFFIAFLPLFRRSLGRMENLPLAARESKGITTAPLDQIARKHRETKPNLAKTITSSTKKHQG
jgi:hypothetical protein